MLRPYDHLSHGQIVAEGTLLELQRKFVNKTIFEIVAVGNRIDLQKVVFAWLIPLAN